MPAALHAASMVLGPRKATAEAVAAATSAASVASADALALAPAATLKSRAKRLLRVGAAFVFRRLRPFARPLAFRSRAYVNTPILAELHGNMGHLQYLHSLSDARHAQVLGQVEALRREQQAMLEFVQRAEARANARQRANSRHLDELRVVLGRIENYSFASARRVAINCGPNEVMVRTASGYLLCSANDPSLISSLLEGGELEPGTRAMLQRLLRPGDTFVDVGANVGLLTLAAATTLQGSGRVVAFEPFEETCALLRKSVYLNGHSSKVEIHQAAVSDRAGTQPLFLGNTSGHHSLYPLDEGEGGQAQVQLVRLDDVLAGQRVDVLKIDAEGAELQVLAGASQLLRANPGIGIVAEFGLSHLARTGSGVAAWLAPFHSHGFEFRLIDESSGALHAITQEALGGLEAVNLFFARPGAAAWRRMGLKA